MASDYAIEQILQKHKITDYLAARGIFPTVEGGGRWKYPCPLHNDIDPSFVVYPGDEKGQNFFCYGCKAGGNIIMLKMKLERVGGRKAIEDLSDGINITLDDELGHFVRQLEEQSQIIHRYGPDELLLLISRRMFFFLNYIKYEQPYFGLCEKLLQSVDGLLHKFDLQTAQEIYERLDPKLDILTEQYDAAKEQEIADAVQSYSKIGKR